MFFKKIYSAIRSFAFTIFRGPLWKRELCRRNIAVIENGEQEISVITDRLKALGADVFADYGTLLGLVRDGHIIQWDYDIDFGIHINSFFTWRDLEEAMKNLGYVKNHQFYFNGIITEQNYSKGKLFIDFFMHSETNRGSVCYVYDRFRKNRYYPSDLSWDVIEYVTPNIHGTSVFNMNSSFHAAIPDNAEKYLSLIYGDNWRTPDPDWKELNSPAATLLKGKYGIIEEFNNVSPDA